MTGSEGIVGVLGLTTTCDAVFEMTIEDTGGLGEGEATGPLGGQAPTVAL